jgi:hypothetical protein
MGRKISKAALFAFARDVAGLSGIALVSYGAWLIYSPAGFIAGGAILLAGAVASARGGS